MVSVCDLRAAFGRGLREACALEIVYEHRAESVYTSALGVKSDSRLIFRDAARPDPISPEGRWLPLLYVICLRVFYTGILSRPTVRRGSIGARFTGTLRCSRIRRTGWQPREERKTLKKYFLTQIDTPCRELAPGRPTMNLDLAWAIPLAVIPRRYRSFPRRSNVRLCTEDKFRTTLVSILLKIYKVIDDNDPSSIRDF